VECTTAEQVEEQLQGRISLIVDGGKSPRTISSTIVHFKEDGTWQILREGAIPAKDIVEALS
jgi:L-threonylcarbamoyladenylate synthase